MPVDPHAVLFADSLKQVASNPGFVAGTCCTFGEDLELPLTRGNFGIDTFDVDAGIKANVKVFVDKVTTISVASSNRAVVWTLSTLWEFFVGWEAEWLVDVVAVLEVLLVET